MNDYKNHVYLSAEDLITFCPLKHKKPRYNKDGEQISPLVIKSNQFNIGQILRYHPYWTGRFILDELNHNIYFNQVNPKEYKTEPGTAYPLPFNPDPPSWRELQDLDMFVLIDWFMDWYDIRTDKKTILQAIHVVASEVTCNPLRDYLEGLEEIIPDKTKSLLDTWLIRYFGVQDTPLTRAYARKTIVAALARVLLATERDPVKVDTVLCLYGGQGIAKGKALAAVTFKKIFGRRYFSDALIDMTSKDAVQIIQGKVIFELKELAKRTKDRNLEKAFIDMQIDRIRIPHAVLPQNFVRRTIFIATTNDREFLTDPTGSRRFWPVECALGWVKHQKIDVLALEEEAEELWKEGMYYIRNYVRINKEIEEAGTLDEKRELLKQREEFQWWLTDEEEELRENESSNFTDEHPLTQTVLASLEKVSYPITLEKILHTVYPDLQDKTRRNKAIIKDILLTRGYKQYRHVEEDGKTQRAWRLLK